MHPLKPKSGRILSEQEQKNSAGPNKLESRSFYSFATLLLVASLCLTAVPNAFGQYYSNNNGSPGNNYTGPMGQVTLVGDSVMGWNGSIPGPTIYSVQGQTISLNLISNDTFDHQFFLDINHDRVPSCLIDKCSAYFDTTLQYTFSVDLSPGTYNYYCALYRDTMHGRFVVFGPNGTSYPSGTGYSSGYSNGGTSYNSGSYGRGSAGYSALTSWANSMSAFLSGPVSPKSTGFINILVVGFLVIFAAFTIVAIAAYPVRRRNF